MIYTILCLLCIYAPGLLDDRCPAPPTAGEYVSSVVWLPNVTSPSPAPASAPVSPLPTPPVSPLPTPEVRP